MVAPLLVAWKRQVLLEQYPPGTKTNRELIFFSFTRTHFKDFRLYRLRVNAALHSKKFSQEGYTDYIYKNPYEEYFGLNVFVIENSPLHSLHDWMTEKSAWKYFNSDILAGLQSTI